MPDPNDVNQLSLTRFAFNIYGALNQAQSFDGASSTSPTPSMNPKQHPKTETVPCRKKKLVYNFEREVSCISQFNYSLNGLVKNYEEDPLHHLIIGGKNYLKLLALNNDQTKIVHEIDILELSKSMYSSSRTLSSSKLTSVNTIESQNDTIACEIATGLISVYKVQNNGKCKLVRKYSDHKRCVNSLDFINQLNFTDSSLPYQLISGSQDGTIKLWDLRSASNKPTLTVSSNSHSDPVRSCQYSPHSTVRNKITILSVHDSGALCKYDLRSPNGGYQHNISVPERKWNFHTGPALSLNIHPEKEYVITGGRDQKVCIWNYGDSPTHQNKMSPDYMINTYGPVMKIRWSAYPDNISSKTDTPSNQYQQMLESKRYDDKTSSNERETISTMSSMSKNNPLFNYDFACLFLNEDPTISIYNLKRKYIPKEVISSNSNKPFQNFMWARNFSGSRRIWTITKSNQFTSYDLDTAQSDPNIIKPLDTLTNVSMTWNSGLGDLCFVNQEKEEFESISQFENESFKSENEEYDPEFALILEGGGLSSNSGIDDHPTDERSLKYRISSNSLDNSSIYNNPSKLTVASIPIASNPSNTPLSYQYPSLSNSVSPPFEHVTKPLLQRASTHNPMIQPPKPLSSILQNRSSLGIEALMEYGNNNSGSNNASVSGNHLRPTLNRNHSQSTQGSNVSLSSSIQAYQAPQPSASKRVISVNHPSPYIIPLSLPLPQNDEHAFEILSNNYLITASDGLNLIDVCLYNANIAASVNKYRDSQTWRVLAVGLEDDKSCLINYEDNLPNHPTKAETTVIYGSLDAYDQDSEVSNSITQLNQTNDNRSIISELDNFVGSYNSNSTLTSNYGGIHSDKTANSSELPNTYKKVEDASNIGPKKASFPEIKPLSNINSPGHLRDVLSQNRSNSNSSVISRSNSTLLRNRNTINTRSLIIDNESAIDDDELVDAKASEGNEDNHQFNTKNSELKKHSSMSAINSEVMDNFLCNTQNPKSSPIKIELEKHEKGRSLSGLTSPHNIHQPNIIKNRRRSSLDPENTRRNSSNKFNYRHTNAWDLDNENSNILSNRSQWATNSSLSSCGISSYQPRIGSPNYSDQLHHSYSSTYSSPRPYYNTTTPGSSRRNSHISPVHGFHNKTSYSKQSPVAQKVMRDEQARSELKDVQEQIEDQESIEDTRVASINFGKSGLTRAITENNQASPNTVYKPWKTENLLEEALEFASLQGDIVLCSTLTILFYDYLKVGKDSKVFTKEQSLDWLSLYVEILRRKQLFSNAMYVINMAPKELLPDLANLTSTEVNLRFFCCWCQRLLVNDKSKRKALKDDSFGYWYCDECSTKQLNCIYCHEPCKGLNIVTSLSCGHRGHFGCLREWFVDQENIECPGGCDEQVV
ncbi:Restriction of telomere capping protein 1 [Debaryomyces fabryi]|uniref:Restriction of telomere capping protein 1 n=1 Tax=Debaryomyces fabryi TaxID=58627 RepID=A0A0V1PXC9_9ASCO|nr:Restriction of telomere capping protein 1 [Debaryomyces fabryi]KSA00910.1 Restriction of telomere capping protein 1 [Debaryomyces fabryi]CUM51811.1 unnamed protein product [Debaryomyces fabryi]